MMITINRNIEQELDCLKLRTKLLSKTIKLAIALLAFAIFLIFICQNDTGVTPTSILMYCCFEILLLISSYAIFKNIYKRKKLLKTSSISALQKYATDEIYSTLIIDATFFIFESKKKYYKLSWPSFARYQINDGNFALMMNESYGSAFIIKRSELTSAEFSELHDYVSKNVPYKKL